MIQSPEACLPTLHATRIHLRALRADDVTALYGVFGDPQVMRYWSRPAFVDQDEVVAYLARIQAGFVAQRLYQWGIADARTDAVIGTTTLYDLDPDNRRCGIGYALRYDRWGQGLAREAMETLLAFCFSILPLRRLEADVDPRNLRSCKLLERLGFRPEGLLRERWEVAGEITDSAIYGLLKHQWETRED